MLNRRVEGQSPQMIFTSDFQELVRGDLKLGPCLLRYDPRRIVPAEELANLPNTQVPITVHIRCHPAGEPWEGELRFPAGSGLLAASELTAGMLEIQCHLPAGCDELECWFSFASASGATLWDSECGANFWLRFPAHDLRLAQAQVSGSAAGSLDLFQVEVNSIAAVEAVIVRWRYTSAVKAGRQERALTATASDGGKTWFLSDNGVPVSWNTPLAFDLIYFVRGHRYKDDNDGALYIVSK